MMRLDTHSTAALWRLAFRLLVVAAFASLWPGEAAAKAAALLCFLLAAGCVAAAFAYRERSNGPSLNRWHEAAVLLVAGTVIFLATL
jgi:hypothetical protein